MYKNGDGVTKNEIKAEKFKAVAKDLIDQEVQRRERMKFQEGVETAGTAEIKV
jgi:hypothetical protein